ncbi:DNA excision repair protein ERCC-6-like isoform X3 [Parambassis ranga]|uniref:DNA excision repair protein ERCC-6-like n=1 Tax=Parambassis ranga TaxID=210632 RepID=A0A6P7J2Z5_9TELE|nr:DNA excision repair protein ERCC-6-like isoform X2 [Parambassis ranga]XP_028271069.1 DNA excision repair protein ERCC-6-like isoform X3 [Parambassis ranga]
MDAAPRSGEMAEVSEQLQRSLSIHTEDKMDTYRRFIQDGKDVARQGDMHKALEFFKLAYDIHQSQKLEGRIKKIEELVVQNDSDDEDEEFVNVNNSGLMLFKELHDKLYDYQRDGVAFLYSLYRDGLKGGILADDMGLGKTIQVISFLSGMYDNELVKHALLVMPTSLITNWTKEFAKWTPGMRVKEFHGISKNERTRNLEKVQRRGGVIITTYTMLMNNWQQLSSHNGREFQWDYMILDEAHKIKSNTTKTAKSVNSIPSKNRVLLTGTPVQNNLREMWALFDFACQGALLGTAKTFKTQYENPITRAREKDATAGEKALGSRMSENLMAIIKPYFLRRTKTEVQKNKMKSARISTEEDFENKDGQPPNHHTDSKAAMPNLTRKNDLIVWTYLSAIQENIYRQFISLDHIKELLLTTRSPLAELNILKKLCDHPRLLSAGAITKLGLEQSAAERQQGDDSEEDINSIANIPDDTLISESGKLEFLFQLVERLREEGHRTLIFAHYRKVLDIIERILGNRGFKVLRLDGTITQLAERERRISLFQNDKRYTVFLLTTQVGGVGITLTAANRVVIYDPSWNPATDAQAVDRAYRIGQTKNVVIYRLITCGTVEEKIYRRQVFKDSLIRQNTGDKKNPFRYFSKQELKELFTLEDTQASSTQLQLQALHSRHRRTDPKLDEHIAHLHAMTMFGISDHDLMFSLDVNHDEALENHEEHHYIEGRVQKAQELMKAESELQSQLAESMASSTEPAWLRRSVDSSREQSHKEQTGNPRSSSSHTQHDSNLSASPVVVDSDLSGYGKEDHQNQVIDLTADDSTTEEQPAEGELTEQNLESPRGWAVKQEKSFRSPLGVAEESLVQLGSDAAAGDRQLLTAEAEESEHGNSEMECGHLSVNPKRFSDINVSTETSLKLHSGLKSLNGSFNLQLEDSDMFSDHNDPQQTEAEEQRLEDSDMFSDHNDPQQTEAEEQQLLSQLQLEGSFNVDKSLSEKRHTEASRLNGGCASDADESIHVPTRKKSRAVIYDSEEEEADTRQQLENSFQVNAASTPKALPSGSASLRSRSVGGNTSVASRRSFLQSIIEDMDTHNRDGTEEEGSNDDVSEINSEEAEKENLFGSNHEEEDVIGETLDIGEEEEGNRETLNTEEEEMDEEEEEDIIGETLNTEEEEDEEEEEEEAVAEERKKNGETLIMEEDAEDEYVSAEEMSLNLEESTSEPELASSERVDQCTVRTGGLQEVESESYESLVCRGRECYSRAQLDQALGFFLRAIDLKPGDPEVQLMTIQLYRQLSQTRC